MRGGGVSDSDCYRPDRISQLDSQSNSVASGEFSKCGREKQTERNFEPLPVEEDGVR